MAIIGNNWLDSQASRQYPIDDSASGISDTGAVLKDDILLDVQLRWPKIAGQYAFLGGITVTQHLVTAVFLAADSPTAATNFTPLASITIQQPATRHRYYDLKALYPGVGGFIAFGDVGENFTAKFSTPAQSLLAPRVGSPYNALPIPGMRKQGRADALTGLVRILAGPGLEIIKRVVAVNDDAYESLVIRLATTTDETQDVLARYIGPCGSRPESRNCIREGIESVSGVYPDCNGNLQIDFRGISPAPFAECGAGITLEHSLGIEDVCEANTPPQHVGIDQCESASSVSAGDVESMLFDAMAVMTEPTSSESIAMESLPFTESFFLQPLHSAWELVSGRMQLVESPLPAAGLVDGSRNNLLVWKGNNGLEPAGRLVHTYLQLTNQTFRQNGGILLNYRPDSYHVVQLNRNDNRVELLRFNGQNLVVEHAVAPGLPFATDEWYSLQTIVSPRGSRTVDIQVIVEGATDPSWPVTRFTVSTSRYGDPDGYFGIYTNRAISYFTDWELRDA